VKEGIHPDYKQVEVVCACGNRFFTRSTAKEIHVEICSNCHPFYTGQQKMMDTAGRVERFRKKYANVGQPAAKPAKPAKPAAPAKAGKAKSAKSA
jgi:large subunit ribosomal protein L31